MDKLRPCMWVLRSARFYRLYDCDEAMPLRRPRYWLMCFFVFGHSVCCWFPYADAILLIDRTDGSIRVLVRMCCVLGAGLKSKHDEITSGSFARPFFYVRRMYEGWPT